MRREKHPTHNFKQKKDVLKAPQGHWALHDPTSLEYQVPHAPVELLTYIESRMEKGMH